jgi:hypothetical protein
VTCQAFVATDLKTVCFSKMEKSLIEFIENWLRGRARVAIPTKRIGSNS